MEYFHIVFVMLALLAAGAVKGVIGLGLPLTAISIMSLVIDIRIAIAVISIPIVVTNIYQAFDGGKIIEIVKKYWLVNLYAMGGTIAGVQLLFVFSPKVLSAILGSVVVTYVALNLLRYNIQVPDHRVKWVTPFIGISSGLLTGTTGSVGVPIALFLQARGIEKESFIRAIAFTFLTSSTMLVIALIEKSAITRETALISVISLIPAFLGMYLGKKTRSHLSERRFRSLVFFFLTVGGINLIQKSIF